MNFYKHHIGDYAAATAHLSFTEDAAYTRLLRIYYRDERPLPVEIRAVQRLVGARMPEEQEAVETVLREFFRLTDDGWHNKRCDEEIAKAQEQAATNRRIAEEREARRKATKPDVPVHESCNESSASREPSHKPLATSQTPEKEHKQKPARAAPVFVDPPDWLDAVAWAEWCQYRKGKRWQESAQCYSINELDKLRLAGHDPAAVIRQSIAAGWTGLFPLKTNGSPNGTHRPSLVERVRANAEAGERADRGQAHRANGNAHAVDPHGGDLRPPLDGDFRRIDGRE